MKCVACGSESLIEGNLVELSNGGTSSFKIKDIPVWKSVFGMGVRKIRAYGCVNCDHLQLAVDFSDDDRERFRQFEGEQPSLLERLNSED